MELPVEPGIADVALQLRYDAAWELAGSVDVDERYDLLWQVLAPSPVLLEASLDAGGRVPRGRAPRQGAARRQHARRARGRRV